MALFRAFLVALLVSFPLGAGAQLLGGLDRLEKSLQMRPDQKAQFDVAVAATQRAMLSVGLSVLQMKSELGAQLLTDRPDPRALADLQDRLVEQNRPLFRAARQEWIRLYMLLDEEQVAIARTYIDERMRRLETIAEGLRDFLDERLGQRR